MGVGHGNDIWAQRPARESNCRRGVRGKRVDAKRLWDAIGLGGVAGGRRGKEKSKKAAMESRGDEFDGVWWKRPAEVGAHLANRLQSAVLPARAGKFYRAAAPCSSALVATLGDSWRAATLAMATGIEATSGDQCTGHAVSHALFLALLLARRSLAASSTPAKIIRQFSLASHGLSLQRT